MTNATVPILVALVLQCGLGLAVFQANPKRKSNQCFLLLSLSIAIWLGSLYYAFSATNAAAAELAIREASAAAPLILLGFNFLRLSIREKDKPWRGVIRHSRTWLVVTTAVIILCQTKLFLEGAQMPEHSIARFLLPKPVYGAGVPCLFRLLCRRSRLPLHFYHSRHAGDDGRWPDRARLHFDRWDPRFDAFVAAHLCPQLFRRTITSHLVRAVSGSYFQRGRGLWHRHTQDHGRGHAFCAGSYLTPF